MTNVKVNNIKPTGADLFNDSESFLRELKDQRTKQFMGGKSIPTVHSPLCVPTL